MSSIISILSFLILLLATFSYSVPIGGFYGNSSARYYENSTGDYQYATGQPMYYQKELVNIVFRPSNNSGNTTVVVTDLSSEYSNSNELTQQNVTRSSRTVESATDSSEFEDLSDGNYEESSVPSSTQASEKRAFDNGPSSSESESTEKRSNDKSEASYDDADKRSSEESVIPSAVKTNKKQPSYRKPFKTIHPKGKPSSGTAQRRTNPSPALDEIQAKRSFDDYLYTTMESNTTFNQRVIRPLESGEVVESSTGFYGSNQTETNVIVGSFSSVEAFGNYTGLFHDGQNYTSEYATTESPVQGSRLIKTVSVIPGQITQTGLSGKSSSKFAQPLRFDQQQQQQLSQVQDQ